MTVYIDTPRERTKFQGYGWKDLEGGVGITRRTAPGGWMREHDLAVEAYDATHDETGLPFEAYRDLVSAAGSGLPIILTHRGRDGSKTRRTYVVEQFISYSTATTANLHVRAWGFAFPIALRDLVDVTVPEQEFDVQ